MKVSLNLAQEFSNVDLKSIPREELLQRIGAQLGAVEDVVDWAPKFEGAVIVKVISCEKHPDADKLNVCRVDDGGANQSVERGEDGFVQVVCGAPNARAGMYAVWLAPGVTVPKSRATEPFVLGAREIRGVVSNGMMASASELGISEDHSGIVDITAEDAGREPVPGEPLTNYFGLDDFVIECENKMFTHRPDCFGNLGVARELAGISGLKFESPDWYLNVVANIDGPFSDLALESKCETKLVQRFTARVLEGVSVHASPFWLQATLARVGIKPINNIVDWSNYYMHLTAQPTHAFDYDKVKMLSNDMSPVIFPRMAVKGEKLQLLGGKEIELSEGDIVIATDKQPIALAGIMGGAETEVDENTKNIIIEAATFDMYNIRRSSMRHGLFTDASNRFNKGQSPYQNLRVLHKIANDIVTQTGAKLGRVVDIIDCDNVDTSEAGVTKEVSVSTSFINSRLGSQLSAEDITLLLKNVEFSVQVDGDNLRIFAPFWRMDIEIPEDIVEEVGRLYGYNKLPVQLPKRTAKPVAQNKLFEFKQQLRLKLKESGANEVLTYSFVHGDLLRKTGTDPEATAYHLRNALSPDLQYYRTSLMPSLLAKVHTNIKAQAGSEDNQFALFEIGKAHVKGHESDGLPEQFERLALVVTADNKTASSKQSGAAYYLAKKYLDYLTNNQAQYTELGADEHQIITAHYQKGRVALVAVNNELLGVIGEYSPSVRRSLKLPEFSAGFELNIVLLHSALRPNAYRPLPSFPGTSQDYTIEVPEAMKWQVVRDAFDQALLESAEGYYCDVETRDIFQAEGETKRITFRVYFSHPQKTLTTDEATKLLTATTNRVHQILSV